MQIMNSKNKEKKEEKQNNSAEFVVNFNRPKNKEVGGGDVRLNELVAQSHLSAIIKPKD